MSNLGMGVMIGMLGGNEDSVNAFKAAMGKTIKTVELKDDSLRFQFSDDSTLTMSDEGQSCCESRYMRTDDNLSDFVGATLIDAEIKEAPSADMDYGDHDIQFLAVKTSKGNFTMSNHNEHNGYYGGFWIVCK